eukprot:scaffold70205_cov57-Phaeocystis_antarctica.AAC.2
MQKREPFESGMLATKRATPHSPWTSLSGAPRCASIGSLAMIVETLTLRSWPSLVSTTRRAALVESSARPEA